MLIDRVGVVTTTVKSATLLLLYSKCARIYQGF